MSNPDDITEPETESAETDASRDPEPVESAGEADAEAALNDSIAEEDDAERHEHDADEPAPVETPADAIPEPLTAVPPAELPAEPPPATVPPIVERTTAVPPRKKRREGDSLWELVKTVVYAVLIAVVFRTVLFQPFNIPSGSMENTLLIGDYLFITKFSYGYSLYSLPWGYWVRRHVDLPGRILASEPERGDIVVFKYPPDNKTDFIKRLVGLPGDRIQVKDGVLFINDKPVPKVRVADYVETDEYGNTRNVPRYKETLPDGGPSYYVLDRYPDGAMDNTDVFVVPPGHYFMMGDNRDNSDDSRGHVGMVPFENLEGRARFIWFSIDESARLFEPWTWFSAIRYDRLGTFVD